MNFAFLAAAADSAEIQELAQRLSEQRSQMETTAVILGIVIVVIFALITWGLVRWVDRRGFGVIPMIAVGVLTPFLLFITLFSVTIGSPAGILESLASGRTQPILGTGMMILIGPLVTWAAFRKRRKSVQVEIEQSTKAFD
mgnify:CR=1 FL=1